MNPNFVRYGSKLGSPRFSARPGNYMSPGKSRLAYADLVCQWAEREVDATIGAPIIRHTFIGGEGPLQSIASLFETSDPFYSATTGVGF